MNDVRQALLSAALEELAEHGGAGISLRAVARRAGVSHAAPKHHFGDRAGLLTAIAVDGFRRLAAAPAGLHALGRAYFTFGTQNPALFDLMFRGSELHGDDDDLLAAQAETMADLRRLADDDVVLVAWAFVHGLVVLQRDGALTAAGGDADRLLAAFGSLT